MTHGSLFSGIGGFDLASEWMGWENIFHCEWNEFGKKILNYYWPKAISYHDITETDFTIHRGTIDILTGGFPCQPYSSAGEQRGTADERHLWPEMLRAIREIQPLYVVGENVSGLVSWSNGLVFEQVQIDLETQGYEVTPFLLPAAGIDAPHKRERIWFIANAGSELREKRRKGGKREDTEKNKTRLDDRIARSGNNGVITDPYSQQRCEGRVHESGSEQARRYAGSFDTRNVRSAWENFPTQPPVCNGNDGVSGKLDGITFSNWRLESVKAGGNAIVPQVAHNIFKAIEAYEQQISLL